MSQAPGCPGHLTPATARARQEERPARHLRRAPDRGRSGRGRRSPWATRSARLPRSLGACPRPSGVRRTWGLRPSPEAPLLRFRGLLRHPVSELTVLLAGLARAEGLELEDLANLDVALLKRDALRPLDSLVPRRRLDEPEARDELLGLRKWTIDHGPLRPGVPDAGSLRGGLEPLRGEEHARPDQVFVVARPLGQLLF